ncbi:OmpA family protein [Azospirillum sp. HJ39]|uniref:OmpA family protein n=1 Tax=Azospirillum sp. HJ39 TaxID=3159496 RepID=UPI003558C23D
MVFFEEQSALDTFARDVTASAANQARANPGATVKLFWFADTGGSLASVAQARADAVRAYLLDAGIPAQRIVIIGREPRGGIDPEVEAQRVLIEIGG